MEATGGYENVLKNKFRREKEYERPRLNHEKCQPAKSKGLNAKGRWKTKIIGTEREKGLERYWEEEVDEPEKQAIG